MRPDDTARLARMAWHVYPAAASVAGGAFRALERAVTGRVSPTLRDPVVREHAAAYHVRKRVAPKDAGEASVELVLFAPAEAEPLLVAAVDRHAGGPDLRRAPTVDDRPELHPVFREYLQGLTDVTAMALDLHTAEALSRHQCFLIEVGCRAEDPRFALHPHLVTHSGTYLDRSGADPSGRWSWAHERFWARCYTPGPDRSIGAPLTSLWNIVLGLTPRRGDAPDALADRLAICCS